MAEVLTKEEKMGIINAHKRNVEVDKFNFELSLIEENALPNPNTEIVSDLTNRISHASARLTALNAELASLEE